MFTEYMLQFFIAVFYYTLGNFHPLIRASLKSIQLIAIVTYPLLKQYGFESILKPFIEEMNSLTKVICYSYVYTYIKFHK